MNFWRQVPNATKINIGLIVCLILLLFGLIILRAAFQPIGIRLAEAVFDSSTETFEGQQATAATVIDGAAAPSLPPGAPWLRAITQATIRTGPGLTYDAISQIAPGAVVPVIGTDTGRQWWAVQNPNSPGGIGWIAAGEVIVENAANVPIESGIPGASIPTDLLPIVQAVTNVNVRSGPDLRYQKIGALEANQTAEIVGKSEDGFWYAIRLPEAKEAMGWVARDYVVTRNADDVGVVTMAPTGLDGNATISPGKPFISAVWDVNIRAGPGTDYAIIGTLKQGASAEIVGRSEDGLWWAIQFLGSQNERGWVTAEFVRSVNGESAPILR